jgi:hypothetical protein
MWIQLYGNSFGQPLICIYKNKAIYNLYCSLCKNYTPRLWIFFDGSLDKAGVQHTPSHDEINIGYFKSNKSGVFLDIGYKTTVN